MDTPLRRSRRLEGLKPEAVENLASAGRARRALVRFESGPEEAQAPRSPVSAPQPGPGSPPSPPGLQRSADVGSPRGERGSGLESPPRQPEARPGAPQSAESPGSPPPQLQSGPGSPGSSQAPAAGTVTGGLGAKKRHGPSDQAPAAKKLKREREEALPVVPRGKPKSGRVWKDRSKKRFSQMVQDKPLRTSWQRKMQERQQRQLARDLARHLEEEKARRRQEKKQRRAENLRRRLENERRAEVVQVIRNPAKLKRAKKKQLRSVQKRDTLALLQRAQPCRPGPEA